MKTLGIFIFLLLTSSIALANPPAKDSPCAESLKKCFAQSGLQKSNCFYSTGRDKSCVGSKLGNLIFERWSYAADSTSSGQTHPGLLGPTLVDENCLNSCDTKWLSQLLTGSTNISEIKSCLAACQSTDELKTLRP